MQGFYQILFSNSVIQRLLSKALLHQWLIIGMVRPIGAWHYFLLDRRHHDATAGHVALNVSIFSSGNRGGWTSWSQRTPASHKLYSAINSEYKMKWNAPHLKQKIVQWLTFPPKTYYIYFKTAHFRDYVGIWYKTCKSQAPEYKAKDTSCVQCTS